MGNSQWSIWQQENNLKKMGQAGASLCTPPTTIGSRSNQPTHSPESSDCSGEQPREATAGRRWVRSQVLWPCCPMRPPPPPARLHSLSAGASRMGGQAPASPPASSPGLAWQLGPCGVQAIRWTLQPCSALGAHPVTPPARPPLALSLTRRRGQGHSSYLSF